MAAWPRTRCATTSAPPSTAAQTPASAGRLLLASRSDPGALRDGRRPGTATNLGWQPFSSDRWKRQGYAPRRASIPGSPPHVTWRSPPGWHESDRHGLNPAQPSLRQVWLFCPTPRSAAQGLASDQIPARRISYPVFSDRAHARRPPQPATHRSAARASVASDSRHRRNAACSSDQCCASNLKSAHPLGTVALLELLAAAAWTGIVASNLARLRSIR